MNLQVLRSGFERVLEAIVVAIVIVLTAIVVAGVVFRYMGSALSWYDETASIVLVWLTYYGAALAALKGSHIGVPAFVNSLPPHLRLTVTLFAEACVFLFFIVLTWTGLQVLEVLVGEHMVSVPWMPLWFTQSAVPVGSVLFIAAEAMRLPQVLAEARSARGFMDVELREALEQSEQVADEIASRAEGRP